jgi:DNA primase
MALTSDFTQHVKSVADIVRVVGETVTLKRTGSNYVGLCPFHQEKTPSFSVHATRQFYFCFGCGAKGDVFRFVMEMEKVPFPEAVRRVAQRMGIPIPARASTDEPASPEAKLRKALEEVHERAQAFYRKQLQTAEAAPVRELFRERGVTDESVEEFGLGYAPAGGDALTNFLGREGFATSVLEASGLVLRRDTGGHFDRFRGRWIFPIANENGRTIAFAGRALGSDQPKYLNSPETPLYTKSRVLYNLSRAREAIRKANATLLVEGYMDAIAAWQAGVRNVVASCGTSLTEPQVHMLVRYAPVVIVSYDPDSAGVAATDRSLSMLLEGGMQVRILRLPGALDPDQYIRQSGAEAYQARLAEAQPVFRYLAGRAREIHGGASPEAKLAALNFVLPYVARVPNKLMRAEFAADIAQKMDVSTGLVWEAFRKAALDRREVVETPTAASRVPSAEAMLIRLLLDSEEARREIGNLLEKKGLLEELESRTIVSTLLGMVAGGSTPDVASLADRLDEGQQRLLAGIVFDNEAKPVSIGEINTYITALERKHLQRQRLRLQQRIQEAQKSQDSSLALDLLRQQSELDKELASLI